MAANLTILRKTALMPLVSLLVSLVMVAGQIFNCCRLNEGLSETVGSTAKRIGAWVNLSDLPQAPQEAGMHGDCHGHSQALAFRTSTASGSVADAAMKSHETCLSEAALPSLALQPGSGFPSLFLVQTVLPFPGMPALGLIHIHKPRPQNKSSPPLYLLNLRILV